MNIGRCPPPPNMKNLVEVQIPTPLHNSPDDISLLAIIAKKILWEWWQQQPSLIFLLLAMEPTTTTASDITFAADWGWLANALLGRC